MTDQTTVPGTPDTTVPPPANAQIPDQQVPAFDGPEWLARFPDDVKTDRSLWKYSNDESAVRGLINAQRLIGADKVAKPKGDFDPANPDWGAFLEAAGRPKSADEYKFGEAKLTLGPMPPPKRACAPRASWRTTRTPKRTRPSNSVRRPNVRIAKPASKSSWMPMPSRASSRYG